MNNYSKYSKNGTEWECVIGLEIHAQINTKTKLFSNAKNNFGAEPNSQVDIFDAALPGVLPVLNDEAVRCAVKTGLAINSLINKFSSFDRKHYFYPDLPSGYQISQFYYPIVSDGKIEIETENSENSKVIRINRIHIEQDAGKNIHDLSPRFSYIDLNRAGVPLMEIVSEPDIRSGEEAVEYIKKLQLIMRYIGTCDGDMEKGNLRCDANVSVRKKGETKLGTRCEIKNLNSTSNILAAINFEIKRQIEILEDGGEIEQQTRLFDVLSGETKKLRGKEEAMDYRYFPDPDLLPIRLSDEYIENIKKQIPILPDQRKKKYIEMGLNHEFIKNMISDFDMGNFFENVLNFLYEKIDCDDQKKKNIGVTLANWVNVEMSARLKNAEIKSFLDSHISQENFGKLIHAIETELINAKIAKDVLDKMFENKENCCPIEIIEKEGLAQIVDEKLIKDLVLRILEKNPKQVSEYKGGKEQLYGFFVGQIMKESKGKINPEIANKILKSELDSLK
jgi:aspartyl-tRNA(Asn)/glutamyl-tRNA(Gln) amidotransferase subunit B